MKSFLHKALSKKSFLLKLIYKVYFIFAGFFGYFYRYKFLFRCSIASSARFIGWKNIKLGNNVVICSDSWLNVNYREKGLVAIDIGDNSFIGERNFFSVGKKIELSPYCLTTSNCSFIGASHVTSNVNKAYLTTGVTNDASIIIGANCFFGFDSSVIGNVTIGHGSIIGAKSVVLSDVPPFSIVVGNPAKVIKRFDFSSNEWVTSSIDEKKIPDEQEYLNRLKASSGSILMPYILASKHFSSLI